MDDATTRLLGLEGLAVTAVDEGVDAPVVYLVTADERARRCPECGTLAHRSKGRRRPDRGTCPSEVGGRIWCGASDDGAVTSRPARAGRSLRR